MIAVNGAYILCKIYYYNKIHRLYYDLILP
jgi:hypothetical protein